MFTEYLLAKKLFFRMRACEVASRQVAEVRPWKRVSRTQKVRLARMRPREQRRPAPMRFSIWPSFPPEDMETRTWQLFSGHSAYPSQGRDFANKFLHEKIYSEESNSVPRKICYLFAECKLHLSYMVPVMLILTCKWKENS